MAATAGPALAGGGGPNTPFNSNPETQNAVVGNNATIAFGTYSGFTPGSTVTWNSAIYASLNDLGPVATGPSGPTTASNSGVATVTLTVSQVSTYNVSATEQSTGVTTLAANTYGVANVVVTAASNTGGGSTSGSGSSSTGGSSSSTGSSSTGSTSSSLPKTGASINPAVVATLSGGLLLAGTGTFVFANRRRETASK